MDSSLLLHTVKVAFNSGEQPHSLTSFSVKIPLSSPFIQKKKDLPLLLQPSTAKLKSEMQCIESVTQTTDEKCLQENSLPIPLYIKYNEMNHGTKMHLTNPNQSRVYGIYWR